MHLYFTYDMHWGQEGYFINFAKGGDTIFNLFILFQDLN